MWFLVYRGRKERESALVCDVTSRILAETDVSEETAATVFISGCNPHSNNRSNKFLWNIHEFISGYTSHVSEDNRVTVTPKQ